MKQKSYNINLPILSRPPDAIAIDLDGTLLNSQTQISERNSRAIKKCLERGIPVVIATSRPARLLKRLLGVELMNRCSLVLQNGAIGIGAPPLSGRIKEIIPPKLTRDIIAAILKMEPEMHITVELEGYAFGTNHPRQPDELWNINSATPDMQLPLEIALLDEVTKIAAGGLKRDISHVADAISRRYDKSISVVPANEMTFLNITSKSANKPDTLRRLLMSRKISLDNVIAFGDDIPDVALLSACGIPIAVANAVPEVKAIAEYCTASNDEDGVAVALETILNF
jgi:Cof subfamily protein (haloacid dehalogenase superfamily)